MQTKPCQKCDGTGLILDQQALGADMRDKRIKAHLSLREVARRMGITPPYLSDMELGKRNWNDDRIEMFRKALKTI